MSEIDSKLDAELAAQVDQWIKYDPNPESRAEIEALKAANNVAKLKELFVPRIAFGTAGLRSKMASGYKNMNELVILQTSQGLCRYMEATFGKDVVRERGIVIGYDGRWNSKRFAELTAAVMLSQDVKVYLFDSIACTPYVPFALTQLNCCAGVMVTASHNPKQDNGFKVYWENGAQIIPPQDVGIASSILANLELWPSTVEIAKQIFPKTSRDSRAPGSALPPHKLLTCTPEFSADIARRYNEEAVRTLATSLDKNSQAKTKICYTAMHGVGRKFVHSILDAFKFDRSQVLVETKEQVEPDPEFSTVTFPNPEEGKGALALAIQAADEGGAEVILANDPDADRLAVAVKDQGQWVMLTGNEIAALFAQWCWLQRKTWAHTKDISDDKFVMVASTVSSKHLKAMAKTEGFQFRDTLTGFKWIGNEMLKARNEGYAPLFAFEVEIGFLPGIMTADKDGVRSLAVMTEMVQYYSSIGSSLKEQLANFYNKYGHFKMVNSYFFCDKTEKLEAVFSALRNWPGENADGYPTSCGKYKIASVRDISEGYDSAYEDKRCRLPQMRDSYMITFTFENGATATMRNSGTEPKLKYYVECSAPNPADAQALLDDMTTELIENFMKPQQYGLIPKKVD